jgi:hypothetical protein
MAKQHAFRNTKTQILRLKSSGYRPKNQPKRINDKSLDKQSINLRIRKPVIGALDNIGHPDVLTLVLAVFPEPFPRDHDRHR